MIDHGQGTGDGAKTYGSTANDGDGVLLPVAVIEVLQVARGGEVAGGEDVGHQDQHLLGNVLGGDDKGGVGQWAPHVLGLATVNGVGGGAVAEQLALAAATGLSAHAEEAVSAGGIEGDDDLVAEVELLHIIALGDNLTDELVAADEVGWAFEVAAVEVQVAAAEGGGGDFEDGIGGFLDFGDGTVFDDDLRESAMFVGQDWKKGRKTDMIIALEHNGSHLLGEVGSHCWFISLIELQI